MAYPTDQQIDAAVPVGGTPSRALTNAALKAITANAKFLPEDGSVPLRSVENENFSGGRIKATMGTDPDDCVTLLQLELHNTPWDQVTGKPSTFMPVIGTTSDTAKSGSWTPSWGEVSGKPATFAPTIGTTSTTAKAGDWLPTWGDVTGKPATFAPTIGNTAATAKAGNYVPSWGEITGKPVGAQIVEITASAATLTASAHAGKWLKLNSSAAQTVTIGTDPSSGWDDDTEIQWHQHGAGIPSFVGASGVTILKHSSITSSGLGQYAPGGLKRVGANEWLLFGQLGSA